MSLLTIGLGGLLLLWSLVCLLGGPDGKFGEPESFMYAALFGVLGFMIVFFSYKWFRWSMNGIRFKDKMDMPDQGISITAGTIMKSRTGEKIGWTAGWSGGFIWVVILSIIFLIQNNWPQGLLGLLLVGLAVLSIVSSAPWRHPSTPYWKLMVPPYMVLFGALVWGIWVYGGIKDSGLNWSSLLLLLPLLIPVISMGKKTWNDFNCQMNTSVQDTTTIK